MWPFNPKSPRRKEIRRTKAVRRVSRRQRLARLPLPTILLGLAAALAAAWIVNAGDQAFSLRVGQTLDRAVTARIDFAVFDQQSTLVQRAKARDNSPNYYRLNETLLEDIRGRLMSALTLAKTHADEPAKFRDAAAEIGLVLDDAAASRLTELAAVENSTEYQQAVDMAMNLLRTEPLVEASEAAGRRTTLQAILVDADGDTERTFPRSRVPLAGPETIQDAAESAATAFRGPLEPLRPAMQQSLANMLVTDKGEPRPIYRFDATLTDERAKAARAAVPDQYVQFPRYSVIADVGPITPEEFKLLQREHEAYLNSRGLARAAGAMPWPAGLGRSLLAFVFVCGLVGHYLATRRPQATPRVSPQALTAGILLLLLLITRLAYVNYVSLPAHVALAGQALAAMMLAIVYRREQIVFAAGLTLALLMTLATEQDISFFFVLFAVTGFLALSLNDIRKRGRIILAGAVAALLAGVTTLAAGMLAQQSLSFLLWETGWAAGATLAAAFLVEGTLPLIERLFGFSTSMTLLEWCDGSKPLLRMMAADAPGTYNHSLLVGTLAEAAADAIGANGLLCRAGAYYHDIGKINKPEYFVENQAMRPNRHERLSPAMSVLIIVGHVKDGVEMAKEYGVPASLRPFIPEHHGTTLVEYFYHAASRSRRPDDPAVSDTEYRYPGPKPQSRESAIIMICDGVEGAVRAMSEPTPNRIEDTVEAIVEKRLIDGQFDECDLTFREIGIIRQSLVKSLCAIYHSRIAYPSATDRPGPRAQGNVGA